MEMSDSHLNAKSEKCWLAIKEMNVLTYNICSFPVDCPGRVRNLKSGAVDVFGSHGYWWRAFD